ncbi:MAG: hemolysin III family protein [Ruminococcus sp.]|nr:hemolysin III family protein [Ruminococcus sp.]MBQ7004478.1 hemolysin III family protein [Oscillospiraceae bacterium]
MSKTTEPAPKKKRTYTLGEEIFNSVTHGAGALLSIAGCTLLIIFAAINRGPMEVVTGSIFGASLIILYTMSTLYHAITNPTAKKVFQILDHNTIFLLIAGTYTPFTLCCIKPMWLGWTIFGCIWGAAAFGIVMSSISLERFRKISTFCYILMGWGIILAIKPLYQGIPTFSLVTLICGGVLYSLGVIFYVQKKIRYMHSIWHIFVVGGSVLHWFSAFYAIGL